MKVVSRKIVFYQKWKWIIVLIKYGQFASEGKDTDKSDTLYVDVIFIINNILLSDVY